jgi:hypothetical protein
MHVFRINSLNGLLNSNDVESYSDFLGYNYTITVEKNFARFDLCYNKTLKSKLFTAFLYGTSACGETSQLFVFNSTYLNASTNGSNGNLVVQYAYLGSVYTIAITEANYIMVWPQIYLICLSDASLIDQMLVLNLRYSLNPGQIQFLNGSSLSKIFSCTAFSFCFILFILKSSCEF